ncbi:MAG TPA: V-type ATP synthase subunit E family protein [Nitrososphaerales archaeon]|nr:V-type ATP synthase subunit E family protein [Nitrososphaerales archaeon]
MNGIEYTVKKVSDEALAETMQSLAEAKTSAQAIVAKRMGEAQVEVQRIQEQQQRQAEALRRQITGGAEMTARNKSLEIIEENLNAAFAQAMQKLQEFASGREYESALKTMILEAMEQVGGAEFVVTANSRDQQTLQRVIDQIASQRRSVKISRSSARLGKTIGGVTVASGDGYVMFDNTYEARLERLKPVLRKQIAQLFAVSKT